MHVWTEGVCTASHYEAPVLLKPDFFSALFLAADGAVDSGLESVASPNDKKQTGIRSRIQDYVLE